MNSQHQTIKTDVNLVPRTVKVAFWSAFIILSALVSTYIAWIRGEFNRDSVSSAAFVLGGTTGLVLIPSIVAGFIMLGARLFKRRISTRGTFITIALIWILVVWANVNVANYESTLLDTTGLTPYEPDAN